MSIKLKAKETKQYVGKYQGDYRFVLQTELYNKLTQKKVIREAAAYSGIPSGVITSAWNSIAEVIKSWATEGHSVPIPGVGTMRFAVRAASVGDVEDVSSSLITSRRIIFTPSVEIKEELQNTGINITCYDRNGKVLKQVTSADSGTVEDPDDNGSDPDGDYDGNLGENPLG